MPYAPGIQDISGQLLAQGIGQSANAYAQKVGTISNTLKEFAKNEDDRRKTVAAVQGMLMDPYLQQQLSTNPSMLATAEKVKSGNARLGDVQAFLGTLTTLQHGRDEELKRQQMETQKQYNDALREQSIAQAASIAAATQTRDRQEKEALANAGFLKEAMRNKPSDGTTMQVFQDYISRGGTPTEEAVRMFGGLMSAEGQMGATEQRARAAELRADSATLAAQRREAAAQAALDAKANKPLDPKMQYYMDYLDNMVESGDLTKDEAKNLRKQYVMNEAQRGGNPLASMFGMGAGAAVPSGVPPQVSAAAPQQPQLTGANDRSNPQRVTSKAEYDRLPPGTWYVDPQGNVSYKR